MSQKSSEPTGPTIKVITGRCGLIQIRFKASDSKFETTSYKKEKELGNRLYWKLLLVDCILSRIRICNLYNIKYSLQKMYLNI